MADSDRKRYGIEPLEGFAALGCTCLFYLLCVPPALAADSRPGVTETVAFIVLASFACGFAVSGLRLSGLRNRIAAVISLLLIGYMLLPPPVINIIRFWETGNWEYLKP